MSQSNKETEITLFDQIKKFAIKSMLGFQTVLVFGLGRRLGIFDYLHKKATSSDSDEVSSVTFTLDELSQKLNLDPSYLDGWMHMALECGIFERDESCDKCLKTAPYVYYLLVDRENKFYFGDVLGGFYHMAPYQNDMFSNFKSGQITDPFELPIEVRIDGHRMSALTGRQVEELFAQHFEDIAKTLAKGGSLLEVGCGFGFNLQNWVIKYPNSIMVGIDIDPEAIEFAKEIATKNNWKTRIELLTIDLNEYVMINKERFDVIVLNQVLHEMEPDKNYRLQVFKDLYSLLKDEGLLIVGEHMIPGIFAPKQARYFEIMHKWFEVGIGAHFYDEDSFQDFIDSTPFKNAELIKGDREYFWAIKK